MGDKLRIEDCVSIHCELRIITLRIHTQRISCVLRINTQGILRQRSCVFDCVLAGISRFFCVLRINTLRIKETKHVTRRMYCILQ